MPAKGVEKYFLFIKNKVAAGWRDLGSCLEGLQEVDLDNIAKKHSNDGKECCRELLGEWKRKNGQKATIHVLMEALEEAELQDVVDGLKNRYPELSAGPPSTASQPTHVTRRDEASVLEARPRPPKSPPRSVTRPGVSDSEADPRPYADPPKHVTSPDGGTDVPNVLLINDEYGTAKGGISTINCQLAQVLVAAGARVSCTVLRAPEEDLQRAKDDNVQLIKPDPKGKKTEPTLDWLTDYHYHHYPSLPKDISCIIGHAHITDKAAKSIKERYPPADLVTFTHIIPEDTDYYKGWQKAKESRDIEEDMVEQVDNAKAAFSVGKRIYEHFDTLYRGDKKPKAHYMFLPKPSELFLGTTVKPGGAQKVVLSIGRVRRVERLKGHDLAGQALRQVVREIKNVRWCVRGISEDDHETSQKILEDSLNSPDLKPTLRPYGTQETILKDMKTAHLVLMTSRSEPFGLVGLEAIAAGIPVLISDKTGLAEMIKGLIDEGKLHPEHRQVIVETGVNERFTEADAKRWAEKIVDVLKWSDSEFEKAARFKQGLETSEYWKESHKTFLQACGIPAGAAAQ